MFANKDLTNFKNYLLNGKIDEAKSKYMYSPEKE